METKHDNHAGQVDLVTLFKILKKNLIAVLVAALLCGGAAGAFCYLTRVPTYTSSVSFFVNGVAINSSGEMFVTPSGASTARDLTETFSATLKQNVALAEVQKELQDVAGIELSAKEISRMIHLSYKAQVMEVKVTHPDSEVAYQVARAYEKVAPRWLGQLINLSQNISTDENANNDAFRSNVKVTNAAVKSETPAGRGTLYMVLIGAVLGAALAYVIGYLRVMHDNTIYTEENVKEYFDLPVVGKIPTWITEGSHGVRKTTAERRRHARAMKRGEVGERDYTNRLLSEATPFAVSEAFKVLRTNMCYTTKGETNVVYGVTSAFVGAGKSLLSANAAVSFAQMGKRVLLIDGDMRCPVQQRIFGISDKSQGLSEVLAGVQRDKTRVIRKSGVEGLDLIVGGHEPPNPAELLASENMRELLRYAREHYDVVFVDLPPVGVVTDAGVISDLVTGYVLVVRSAYSDRREIESSVQAMEGMGASVIGFVLNDVDLKGTSGYRNHYYGGYDSYDPHSKSEGSSTNK